jgi:hypothetical protein
MSPNEFAFKIEFSKRPEEFIPTAQTDRIITDVWGATLKASAKMVRIGVLETAPHVTGIMRGSIKESPVVRVRDGFEVVVTSPIPYTSYVEFGTKPHWMPIEPLRLWAQRKFGVDKGLAYGIAKKVQKRIATRGTNGKFMFRDAYARLRSSVENNFNTAADLIIERIKKL